MHATHCGFISLYHWPLTFKLGWHHAAGVTLKLLCLDSPPTHPHRSMCSLCISLFSPSLLVVEEEWRHPAVRPCCHSVQAPPFWLWLLQSVLCFHRGGLIYLVGRLHEEKGDFPCCCRIQLSALLSRSTPLPVSIDFFKWTSLWRRLFHRRLLPAEKMGFHTQRFGVLSQKNGFKVVGSPPQEGGGAPKSLREGSEMLWCLPLSSLEKVEPRVLCHIYPLICCFCAFIHIVCCYVLAWVNNRHVHLAFPTCNWTWQ